MTNIYSHEASQQQVAAVSPFVTRTFGWMAIGLLLTALIAMWIPESQSLMATLLRPGVLIGLIVGELVLVLALSLAIGRMSAGVAAGAFLLYSALNGVTLSVLFLIYTKTSIAGTFIVTAGTFGVMAAYGYLTKRDLTSLGSIMLMALIGLVIASVVNIFWANDTLYWLITYAGIGIFVALTAYDTQKIREMAYAMEGNVELAKKMSILGALRLYLDFINLFLLLLRVLGRRR